MDLRLATLRLPFVSEKADYTLDMWSVTPSGDDLLDAVTGRNYAALFIHYMRFFDAPHMLYHMSACWHERGTARDSTQTAFADEFNQAVIAMPVPYGISKHPAGTFSGLTAREAVLRLPYMSENDEGRLVIRLLETRNTDEDSQLGRSLARCAIQMVREQNNATLFKEIMLADGTAYLNANRPGFAVGYSHVMAEAATTSAADSTEPQKRMLPVYRDAMAGVI